MNSAAIPALPVSLARPAKPRALDEGERLLPTLVVAGALTVLGDFLLWDHAPGLSLALYFAAVAVAMLLRHGRASLRARMPVSRSGKAC